MARLEQTRPTGVGRARGLVSSPRDGDRVHAKTYAPPPDLSDIVESLWTGRWDLPTERPHTTELLGDPALHVVLAWGDGHLPPERVVGPWTRLWVNRLEGRGNVRAIKLRPGAGAALVPDVSALRDTVAPLRSLFEVVPDRAGWGEGPDHDEPALLGLADWLRAVRAPHPETSLAVAIVDRMKADPAILRVDQLARVAGLGERALQRLFKVHVGVTPKAALRRLRLQEAALRMERGEVALLAELALQLGYADQAHFTRDWTAAVRSTPRRSLEVLARS